MNFQYFFTAVLNIRNKAGIVVKHRNGDVGAFLHQYFCQPFLMLPLFQRIMQQLIKKRFSVVFLIVCTQIHATYPLVQREKRRKSLLVCGHDNDLHPLIDQVIGFIGQDPFHATGMAGTGYVIEYFHLPKIFSGCKYHFHPDSPS